MLLAQICCLPARFDQDLDLAFVTAIPIAECADPDIAGRNAIVHQCAANGIRAAVSKVTIVRGAVDSDFQRRIVRHIRGDLRDAVHLVRRYLRACAIETELSVGSPAIDDADDTLVAHRSVLAAHAFLAGRSDITLDTSHHRPLTARLASLALHAGIAGAACSSGGTDKSRTLGASISRIALLAGRTARTRRSLRTFDARSLFAPFTDCALRAGIAHRSRLPARTDNDVTRRSRLSGVALGTARTSRSGFAARAAHGIAGLACRACGTLLACRTSWSRFAARADKIVSVVGVSVVRRGASRSKYRDRAEKCDPDE